MIANPAALEMYWIDGQPFPGIQDAHASPNTTQFWVDGDAVYALEPPATIPSQQIVQQTSFMTMFN